MAKWKEKSQKDQILVLTLLLPSYMWLYDLKAAISSLRASASSGLQTGLDEQVGLITS